MLFTFLKHNEWFKGDLLIIHDDLEPASQKELRKLFPVEFLEINQALRDKVKSLVTYYPQIGNREKRFWSLQAFALNRYTQVLFLDSDTLCTGSLKSIFEQDYSFAACHDAISSKGLGRDRLSFASVAHPDGQAHYSATFNAGFMLFSPKQLGSNTFHDLLLLLNAETFKTVVTGHTDQFLLNKHFESKLSWLPSTYNHLIGKMDFEAEINDQVRIWHFIRHPKPWKWKALIKGTLRRNNDPTLRLWHYYYRCVKKAEIKHGSMSSIGKWLLSKLLAG